MEWRDRATLDIGLDAVVVDHLLDLLDSFEVAFVVAGPGFRVPDFTAPFTIIFQRVLFLPLLDFARILV